MQRPGRELGTAAPKILMMFLALAGLALDWCQLFYQIQVE